MQADVPPGGITIEDLDYELPPELIAQSPPARREDARLLHVDRRSGALRDLQIPTFPELLHPGDLLVLNDTKVLPARFVARRATGGKVGGLYLDETKNADSGTRNPTAWRVLLEGSARLKVGEFLTVAPASAPPTRTSATPEPLRLNIVEHIGPGEWIVIPNDSRPVEAILADYGHTPLPPYIRRERPGAGPGQSAGTAISFQTNSSVDPASGQSPTNAADEPIDRERYQTVYAARPGAVAAPTAGLHLTEGLLAQIRARGIETAFVTLHVGVGTFKPVSAERLDDHIMHSERYELSAATAGAISACRARAGRIVAVGTTTVRVLESVASDSIPRSLDPLIPIASQRGETSIFIRPPYSFRVVDALLTNFHLPRSTLLALVMAFAGIETTRRAYAHAISQRYRFYSYGDAMFLA